MMLQLVGGSHHLSKNQRVADVINTPFPLRIGRISQDGEAIGGICFYSMFWTDWHFCM